MSDPVGWFMAGLAPHDYEAALDTTERHSGTRCVRMSARVSQPSNFGTLMQEFDAVDYRGKRVRLSGWVKTKDIADWCGLWMRIDGRDGRVLAFDNMSSRRIHATTPWTRYEVVLDVDDLADGIFFGLLFHGTGVAWLDDVGFDVVGLDVPTTSRTRPRAPRNLSFEE